MDPPHKCSSWTPLHKCSSWITSVHPHRCSSWTPHRCSSWTPHRCSSWTPHKCSSQTPSQVLTTREQPSTSHVHQTAQKVGKPISLGCVLQVLSSPSPYPIASCAIIPLPLPHCILCHHPPPPTPLHPVLIYYLGTSCYLWKHHSTHCF